MEGKQLASADATHTHMLRSGILTREGWFSSASPESLGSSQRAQKLIAIGSFPKIWGTLFWGPYNQDPII